MSDEDRILQYILGMCQRVERGFTLREIVARVLEERPEMIEEFSNAWEILIQRKLIRVARNGRPSLYEIIDQDER